MPLTVYAEFRRDLEPVQTIAVVGLGYIGLPTAAALAAAGHRVIGVDVNPAVIESVSQGLSHIIEPGLDALLADVVAHGALTVAASPPVADAYLIAAPTPVGQDSLRTPDLTYVFAAAEAIAPVLRRGALIVLESTSPVGATRQMIERLAAARPDLRFPQDGRPESETDIDVVYSPERVIPGKTLAELGANARVIGGATPKAAMRAAALYRSLTSGELLLTDDRSAEFVKLTENAFRDVNIAFANELSVICDKLDLNVWEVIQLANRHPRVDILKPGPGVGGHCIAVDPWFIVAQAPEQSRLIRTAREINDAKPAFVIDQAKALMDADPTARLSCLGLSFKPDIDDFRESPALAIASELTRLYPGRVVCAEPNAQALPADHGLTVVEDAEALAADVIVALVAQSRFKLLSKPDGALVDACGLWH
jgi:UDP-N-acetyl-D-mannosaminuronic acid dehydrogenase